MFWIVIHYRLSYIQKVQNGVGHPPSLLCYHEIPIICTRIMLDSAQPTRLIDRFGRVINYLRVSITDRCDFRCVYCMAENMTFSAPRANIKPGRDSFYLPGVC